jgi:endogenous inhibitor of DNA gyrase (YacG/DUF329 family)
MRCPTCQREFDPASSPALPFCSDRCRTIDLGRWLGEAYSLPATPQPDEVEPHTDEIADGNGAGGERQ